MRKIVYLMSIIILPLTLLVGCGPGNVLEEGEVVGRSYDDPDRWWSSMCVSRNNNGICTVSIPVEETDDAHWYLTVVGYDKEGKQREETHEVTETLYNIGVSGVTVNFKTQEVVPK